MHLVVEKLVFVVKVSLLTEAGSMECGVVCSVEGGLLQS